MRWPLVTYRIALVIFSVIILVISMMCVFPIANQDITIEPQQDSLDWNIDNTTISASGYVWINNSGYFDLQDIKLGMRLSALEELYINSSKMVESIKVGEDRSIGLEFSKDTDEISDRVKDHLINNETDININFNLKGRYSYSFLEFDINMDDVLTWDGLIKNIEFRYQDGTVNPQEDGLSIEVPVDIDTNEMLSGDIGVDVSMYDENESKMYSKDQVSFPLGSPETVSFNFYLDKNEAEEFIDTSQDILFKADVSFDGADFDYTLTETYHWERILNSYDIKYDDAEISTDGAGDQNLLVPFDISTNENEFISGDVLVDISLLNEEKTEKYSGDQFSITLGEDQSTELSFGLSQDDAEELATDSQELIYRTSMTLSRYDYTITYEESYRWGAPLDGLAFSDISYSGTQATWDIAFRNDGFSNLDISFGVVIFDSQGDVVGQTEESYFVTPGDSIDDTMSVTLTGIPDYAEITVTENITGFEYEKEVDVYER